jgi:hypothetical protein
MKRRWFSRYWYWFVIAAVIIAAGALISVFRSNPFCESIITFFDDWSVALSAGAAVILALAAFWSIRENRRIRSEERTLNFRLRLLDEVRDWTREAVKAGFVFKRAVDEEDKAKINQVNEILEDIAKTADITNMAVDVFKNELEAPVKTAVGFVKSYKSPGVLGSDGYFASLHVLLKAINKIKRRLYYENVPPE